MKTKKISNYEFFLHTDTSAYKGEWVAISKNKIVAHGDDAQKVYRTAKQRYPQANVSLAKVPEEQALVLILKSSP